MRRGTVCRALKGRKPEEGNEEHMTEPDAAGCLCIIVDYYIRRLSPRSKLSGERMGRYRVKDERQAWTSEAFQGIT